MRSKAALLALGVALALSAGVGASHASAHTAALPSGGVGDVVGRAKLCLNGGWKKVTRADARPFRSELDCLLYVALGGKFGQSVSFTSANPSPVSAGDVYTPAATATSGLPVAITLDASSTGCTLSGGVVVLFTAAGTCRIDVNQAGNGIWAAAPQAQQSLTVNVPDLQLGGPFNSTSTGSDGVKNYFGIGSSLSVPFSIVNVGSGRSQTLQLIGAAPGFLVIGDTCTGTRLAAHGGTCAFSLLFVGVCVGSPQTFPIFIDVFGFPLAVHYIRLDWTEIPVCTPVP